MAYDSTLVFCNINRAIIMGLICLSCGISRPNAPDKPNIVIILADDLGYGDVSSYNEDTAFTTPHIDRLAENGVQFTDAHTSSAVCTPTRYGLLTGRYNWRSELKEGVLGGYSKSLLDKDRLTIANLFKENNYHTAFVGKWHLGWNWQMKNATNADKANSRPAIDFSQPIELGPEDHGFSYSYGFAASLDMPPYVYVENSQPTTIPKKTTVNYDEKGFWRKGLTGSDFSHADVLPHLAEKATQTINKQANTDHPFFLYFALPAPHTPILPTEGFIGTSNANLYGDFVLQVDDVVGRVTKALEEQGILDNTMVIFASDNGAAPAADFKELAKAGHDPSYIFRGHKADIYEGGHRVPFIVHWPERVKHGFKSDETISTVDIMATVANVIGIPLPDNAGEDSYSLLPILLQQEYSKPLREYTIHSSINGSFAIRKGKWKMIFAPGSGGWSYPRPNSDTIESLPKYQLYNLENDPGEQNNLYGKYPQVASELKKKMKELIQAGRSTPGAKQENDSPLGGKEWEQIQTFFN